MNLKHLRYFWAVAHTGSVVTAANQLHLTPQTVSAQIKLLEDDLGTALFKPAGRGLELTEAGRVALSYADEIFALGHEMVSSLRANAIPEQTMTTFRVGVFDMIPKSLTHRLLASLKRVDKPLRLVCREGTIDWLLGELALHRLEMVLADRPMPAGLAIRGHSRKLGESAVAFFAAPELARRDVAAYGIAQYSDLAASGAVHGLKVVAVAVVAQAVWGMAKSLCPDRTRAALVIFSALLTLVLPSWLAVC